MTRRLALAFCLLPFLNIARAADPAPIDLPTALAGDNPADLALAMKSIQSRLADDPASNISLVRAQWLPLLIQHHHDEAALTLLESAIVATPQSTETVAWFERQRLDAFIRLHRWPDALAAAKSYFNACGPAQTDDALLLLAQCLNGARGIDSPDADHLATEQRAGLAGTEQSPITSPTLRALPPDPAAATVFNPAIRRLHLPLNALPVAPTDLLALGNLLLLADRPADALAAFQKLQSVATVPDQLRLANDGIARAMRAADGTIGRANAFAARLAKN